MDAWVFLIINLEFSPHAARLSARQNAASSFTNSRTTFIILCFMNFLQQKRTMSCNKMLLSGGYTCKIQPRFIRLYVGGHIERCMLYRRCAVGQNYLSFASFACLVRNANSTGIFVKTKYIRNTWICKVTLVGCLYHESC